MHRCNIVKVMSNSQYNHSPPHLKRCYFILQNEMCAILHDIVNTNQVQENI